MNSLTVYNPKERTISCNGFKETFYCGAKLDVYGSILFRLQCGKLTLQEAHTLLLKDLESRFGGVVKQEPEFKPVNLYDINDWREALYNGYEFLTVGGKVCKVSYLSEERSHSSVWIEDEFGKGDKVSLQGEAYFTTQYTILRRIK